MPTNDLNFIYDSLESYIKLKDAWNRLETLKTETFPKYSWDTKTTPVASPMWTTTTTSTWPIVGKGSGVSSPAPLHPITDEEELYEQLL